MTQAKTILTCTASMLTKKAAELFCSGDYAGAYSLYKQAAIRYGQKNFSYNLLACKKKLEEQKIIQESVSVSPKQKPASSLINHYFDNVYVVNLTHQVSKRIKTATQLTKNSISFELFEATNGYVGEPLETYQKYATSKIGTLKRYASYNEREIKRGKRYIESAGAIGYIYTYLRILSDAKKKGYKRFLILEDDILLTYDFDEKFRTFVSSVDDDWKVLQLGASQYGWNSVNQQEAIAKGHYLPRCLDTCGSFAIAFDGSIIDELIEAESAFEAPFDHLPIGEIYERYIGKCFVAFPNIVIADVGESSIRGGRCQYAHSERMKWRLDQFNYPLSKPSVSVVLSHEENLHCLTSISKATEQPFNLQLFFNSTDGLRMLHNNEHPAHPKIEILPPVLPINLPESDYCLMLDEDEILTESNIVTYIEFATGIRQTNTTALKPITCESQQVGTGRISSQ